ncbi:hypothetical protein D1AOALGA4SA_8667 [Olavius algarvensis Delta 1 endosymbiont]|nr:hypothetical protein D1AOALGA4SA_8667 [Olavius algarvensis Delta 1 endosymbiont]
MEVLILTTSHFKSSGHNHLQDIRPYLCLIKQLHRGMNLHKSRSS